MSKIFGYTKKGGQHWFNSDAYSDKEIEAIKDPEGGSEISLPTAIPSPFARIDLVKTAFRNITKSPTLKAYTKDGNVVSGKDDEKLVSDALDLAEMLFNIDSIKDKVKIIVWDREAELTKLKNSSNKGHRQFAETLELYLDQDKESYNFDLLKRLYLIEYNHKIIGCTSPATLFFATANDLTHAQIKLTKNDVTFDDEYTPLYERDTEFQKYLYLLFKANPKLSQRLTVINDYLEKNLKILDTENHKLYEEINNLNAASFVGDYSPLEVSKDVPVEVLSIGFRSRKSGDLVEFISENSEFRISSTKLPISKRPLILKDGFAKEWLYVKDPWNNMTAVPYYVESTIEKRTLPEVRIQYPYLTVSDFLEPYLIRLVYPINKDKFFDGNVNAEVGDDSKGFILPLKKQFFDYFNSDDLVSSLQNKPKLEMVQGAAGSVKVTLKIPVAKQGEYISFERTYYQSSDKPNEEQNKGVIVEHQFGVTLFPFIKTSNPNIEAYYRVQLVDRNVGDSVFKNSDYQLNFYQNQQANNPLKVINEKTKERRSKNRGEGATSQYYVIENEFDFITIKDNSNPNIRGVLIPIWDMYSGGANSLKFAIDFGTTNTHIEYREGAGQSYPLNVDNDIQIATLFDPHRTPDDFGGTGAIDIKELVNHEFIPRQIGNLSPYKFPIRTVIAENETLNPNLTSHPLADYNIPFIYEKETHKDRITSNLKWSEAGDRRVEYFMENIILIIRAKVLKNKGDLSKTELVWFYPSSMHDQRIGELQTKWSNLYKKYFAKVNIENKIKSLPESLAPFYHFKGKLPGGTTCSIDLGGGTTDIVVLKSENPVLISSFRFASNALFGSGLETYSTSINNAIINKYIQHFESLISTNGLTKLTQLLSSIKDSNKSEDIAAFLFSLSEHTTITDRDLFSFSKMLQGDKELKIVFIYFYVAIIFYLAKLIEKRTDLSIDAPDHILFSGRGSKLLKLISDDKSVLVEINKLIFKKVFQKDFTSKKQSIEFEEDFPKEVTAKGGISINMEQVPSKEEIQKLQTTINCTKTKANQDLKFNIETTDKEEIVNFIKSFNVIFKEITIEFINKKFILNSDAVDYFLKNIDDYLMENLDRGVKYLQASEKKKDTDSIEETLFFYPLIGAINNLSTHLSQLTQVNN